MVKLSPFNSPTRYLCVGGWDAPAAAWLATALLVHWRLDARDHACRVRPINQYQEAGMNISEIIPACRLIPSHSNIGMSSKHKMVERNGLRAREREKAPPALGLGQGTATLVQQSPLPGGLPRMTYLLSNTTNKIICLQNIRTHSIMYGKSQ